MFLINVNNKNTLLSYNNYNKSLVFNDGKTTAIPIPSKVF